MFNYTGYYDLNILDSCLTENNLKVTLKTLYDFGYRTIAVNQHIQEDNFEPKKKKKKGVPRETIDIVPVPYDTELVKSCIAELGLQNFNVLNRLTITFSNQETNSPNYKKYHIIAVSPATMGTFLFICSSFEADIITFDPVNRLNFRKNRKLYNQLRDRGYHFEIMYSPAIESSTKKKNIIHASHFYQEVGRSRNVIISSGASNYSLLRSPYDIINLGLILGLSEQQCKTSISDNSRKVIVNSVGRRQGKAVMFVENIATNDVEKNTKKVSLLRLEETLSSDDEDMKTHQPAFKKSKPVMPAKITEVIELADSSANITLESEQNITISSDDEDMRTDQPAFKKSKQ